MEISLNPICHVLQTNAVGLHQNTLSSLWWVGLSVPKSVHIDSLAGSFLHAFHQTSHRHNDSEKCVGEVLEIICGGLPVESTQMYVKPTIVLIGLIGLVGLVGLIGSHGGRHTHLVFGVETCYYYYYYYYYYDYLNIIIVIIVIIDWGVAMHRRSWRTISHWGAS
jgi:hypothetical protein